MYKPSYKEKYKKLYNINKKFNSTNIKKTYTNLIYTNNNISPPPYETFDISMFNSLTPIKLKNLVKDNLIYFTVSEYNSYIDVLIELRNIELNNK